VETQEHKSASKDQVVGVACHFNTTVRHRIMATSSHTEETMEAVPSTVTAANEDCWESCGKTK